MRFGLVCFVSAVFFLPFVFFRISRLDSRPFFFFASPSLFLHVHFLSAPLRPFPSSSPSLENDASLSPSLPLSPSLSPQSPKRKRS